MKLAFAISLLASIVNAGFAKASPPSIPVAVTKHVKNGHFDPGDYGWMRGAFPGATSAEIADWQAISGYKSKCGGKGTDALHTEMTSLGYHPPAAFWSVYVDDVCGELAIPIYTLEGFKTWTSYRQALDAALPFYKTLVFAADRANAVGPIDEGDLRDRLHTIVVPDQMLRGAVSWGQGDASDAPVLDEKSRNILTLLLWRPIRDFDHRNTAWLKAVVAKEGWPTISKVGRSASSNAWLLAQHADDDPVFQVRILRLMTPLADRGEVDRKNYAYLYDRIMLPLTGKQRYGTQMTCDAKGWHPQPLESEADLEKLRKSAGLDPIADYTKQMVSAYGAHCPT